MSEIENTAEAAPAGEVPAEAAAPEAAAPEAPALSPEELLKQQLEESNDRYLRMLAETENYKKRVAKERMEERAYSAQETILAVLPIADNLERALQAIPAEARGEGALGQLVKGVELTLRQFEDVLRRQGVELVPAEVGKPFDPNMHQALFQEVHEEFDDGAILAVLQKGYRIGERVLRPAMIKVSHKP
jgi:molecular chaperone GrpE